MNKITLTLIFILTFNISVLLSEEPKNRIGLIIPLTGPFSEYGLAIQNGIALAKREKPEILKNVEFLYQDSQYKSQTAITIFRSLLNDKKVKLILNFGCPTAYALAPIAEKEKIPTAMYCSAMLLTKNANYSFGLIPPANQWAKILWDFLKERNYKKICLILTENDYLISEFNALKQNVKNSNKSINVIDTFTPDETNFKSTILKIKAKKCDALGVYLLPGQLRTFFIQSKPFQLKTQIFGTGFFESKEEILASKNGMENAYSVNLAVPNKFKKKYLKTFGNDNQITAACNSHDTVLRIAPFIEQGRDELLKSIKGFKKQTLGCGESEFRKNKFNEQFISFPITLKKIVNNEIVEQ